jgi:crossover junction endodeoxyribonuclease RuvC
MKPAAEHRSVRILGIDPGSRRAGWGLLTGHVSAPQLIECGAIGLTAAGAFPDRLHRLQHEIERVVDRLAPTAAAVEAPFHGVNARSALQLAHARGVILAVLAGAGVPVAEYSPANVKKAVTGNGRAEKGQVQSMVGRLLGLDAPGDADVADALAVALCHLCTAGTRGALERAAAGGSVARSAR